MAEVGEDGLHKKDWFSITFKDVAEDIEDARDQGKRVAMIFEQRGASIAASFMRVLQDPDVVEFIKENFIVVQYNLFGDEEVTDFDGTALPEKEMAKRWGVVFTPTILFFMPDEVPEEGTAAEHAVARCPALSRSGRRSICSVGCMRRATRRMSTSRSTMLAAFRSNPRSDQSIVFDLKGQDRGI